MERICYGQSYNKLRILLFSLYLLDLRKTFSLICAFNYLKLSFNKLVSSDFGNLTLIIPAA